MRPPDSRSALCAVVFGFLGAAFLILGVVFGALGSPCGGPPPDGPSCRSGLCACSSLWCALWQSGGGAGGSGGSSPPELPCPAPSFRCAATFSSTGIWSTSLAGQAETPHGVSGAPMSTGAAPTGWTAAFYGRNPPRGSSTPPSMWTPPAPSGPGWIWIPSSCWRSRTRAGEDTRPYEMRECRRGRRPRRPAGAQCAPLRSKRMAPITGTVPLIRHDLRSCLPTPFGLRPFPPDRGNRPSPRGRLAGDRKGRPYGPHPPRFARHLPLKGKA